MMQPYVANGILFGVLTFLVLYIFGWHQLPASVFLGRPNLTTGEFFCHLLEFNLMFLVSLVVHPVWALTLLFHRAFTALQENWRVLWQPLDNNSWEDTVHSAESTSSGNLSITINPMFSAVEEDGV